MFSVFTNERLKLFDSNLVEQSNSGAEIEEPISDGYAKVSLVSENRLVVFKKMERNGLQNLKCKNCADYIVLEECEKKTKVHIFEMKRTVKSKEWVHIKKQFVGAILNAYALSGVIDIPVEQKDIQLYTCYRRDLLQTPIAMRYTLSVRDSVQDISEWNDKEITLKELGESKFKHDKIQLDVENGCATYKI